MPWFVSWPRGLRFDDGEDQDPVLLSRVSLLTTSLGPTNVVHGEVNRFGKAN